MILLWQLQERCFLRAKIFLLNIVKYQLSWALRHLTRKENAFRQKCVGLSQADLSLMLPGKFVIRIRWFVCKVSSTIYTNSRCSKKKLVLFFILWTTKLIKSMSLRTREKKTNWLKLWHLKTARCYLYPLRTVAPIKVIANNFWIGNQQT